MSTVINVTAEHIAKGERQECTRCPIALAIESAIPEADYLAVYSTAAVFNVGDVIAEIALPAAAERFIHSFDLGYSPEPFSFELTYPEATS